MKPKFKLVTNRSQNRRYIKAPKESSQLCLVPTKRRPVFAQRAVSTVKSVLKSCFDLLATLLKRIDAYATQAREIDENIRKNRAEHYAKYGFYFRDRY
jgi:hypothetical protein